MALTRWTPRTDLWDPFASLTDLQEEMNRLFENSLRRFGLVSRDGGFTPPCDIIEERDRLLLRVDLPGVSKDDVQVTLQDGVLTVKGERKVEEFKDATYYLRERLSGPFHRAIELPVEVDAGKIEARFRDGVLEIALPKAEEAKPRQIEVKVG
ncbi:MAG: Hsp20/alpha crystallin family protein [Verrucomicrobiae bacterium]|nr:Hsp20/alpha crystallin family protein [Verrucomicrobiae bacterium]MDW8343592.1 Hsp20/alpha crystallin family protein [Verrucomicrobiae bacterium]